MLDFDEHGNLPYACYEVSLNEFESKFSEGQSDMRKYIMEMYKIQLNKIKDCGYELNHWIYGSYVSNNEPDDIDTLTEFDGNKCDKDNCRDDIQNMIDNAPYYKDYCCHSFCIFYYPKENEIDHDLYLEVKNKYFEDIMSFDRLGNQRGFVRLNCISGGENE